MLRKGLKLAGYEQAVIKTVPRQGLTIPSMVPVARIIPDTSTASAEEIPSVEENQPPTPSKVDKKASSRPRYVWAILLSLSFGVGIALLAAWNSSENKNFFSTFNFVGNIEQCFCLSPQRPDIVAVLHAIYCAEQLHLQKTGGCLLYRQPIGSTSLSYSLRMAICFRDQESLYF
ncbi:Uncharacterised protein [Serratia fonticola]|uniref:Uncharacterized protein n=1 Tax=Serratia fonticola TaxID=47917 RepID=A0A4U9UW51_SERFO|nr:Uncharacterised protein [Serratia fonticola]